MSKQNIYDNDLFYENFEQIRNEEINFNDIIETPIILGMFLTTAVVNDFIQEYPPLRIKPNADCHDRLIVLDYGLTTEQAYHCGASSKDAGKKLCAINVILETSMIHPVIDKLLLAPDIQI